MPAFFARREGNRVSIVGTDAAHIARSLRAKPGEKIEVVDPAGFLLTVKLDSVSAAAVEGTVVAETAHQPEPATRVTIAIASLPAASLDLVFSRCTEAGAHGFVVFPADRSVGRGEKLERWDAIVREAAMLAARLRVPNVAVAPSLDAVLASFANAVVLDRRAPRPLSEVVDQDESTLVIGPEGGWSDRELGLGAMRASLGPRNLRADTAALVALTIALSVRGGWSQPPP